MEKHEYPGFLEAKRSELANDLLDIAVDFPNWTGDARMARRRKFDELSEDIQRLDRAIDLWKQEGAATGAEAGETGTDAGDTGMDDMMKRLAQTTDPARRKEIEADYFRSVGESQGKTSGGRFARPDDR